MDYVSDYLDKNQIQKQTSNTTKSKDIQGKNNLRPLLYAIRGTGYVGSLCKDRLNVQLAVGKNLPQVSNKIDIIFNNNIKIHL